MQSNVINQASFHDGKENNQSNCSLAAHSDMLVSYEWFDHLDQGFKSLGVL